MVAGGVLRRRHLPLDEDLLNELFSRISPRATKIGLDKIVFVNHIVVLPQFRCKRGADRRHLVCTQDAEQPV